MSWTASTLGIVLLNSCSASRGLSHLSASCRGSLQLLAHRLVRELVRRDLPSLGFGLERLKRFGLQVNGVIGRRHALQAGGRWFEPITAHLAKCPQSGRCHGFTSGPGFVWLSRAT